MISNAFKSAYQNEISQQNQGIRNIEGGVSSAASVALLALGFTGGLGEGKFAEAAMHVGANKIGGIGGNIMLASLKEKKDSAETKTENSVMFSKEDIGKTVQTELGDNPINRSAIKKLSTVFETLSSAKEQGLVGKDNQIETSVGKVDPTSDLGKKILEELKK